MDVDATPGTSPYENRVLRSFAFIDLSGFTRFTDAEGDDAAVDILTDFRLRVREIAARRGVRIAKWLGDGAMLVGIEAEPLTEAGVASGPVILFEGDDYIGRAVNLAARLCSLASPGQVVAPATMISTLMVNTVATPIGSHEVQGFAEPVELVQLDARDAL